MPLPDRQLLSDPYFSMASIYALYNPRGGPHQAARDWSIPRAVRHDLYHRLLLKVYNIKLTWSKG